MKQLSIFDSMDGVEYPYTWAWGNPAKYPVLGLRKGQPCRVLVRGAKNSALIEFEDGYQVVTSRNGLRNARIADTMTRVLRIIRTGSQPALTA